MILHPTKVLSQIPFFRWWKKEALLPTNSFLFLHGCYDGKSIIKSWRSGKKEGENLLGSKMEVLTSGITIWSSTLKACPDCSGHFIKTLHTQYKPIQTKPYIKTLHRARQELIVMVMVEATMVPPTLNPKPKIPQTRTWNPFLSILNPKPWSLIPKPETQNRD